MLHTRPLFVFLLLSAPLAAQVGGETSSQYQFDGANAGDHLGVAVADAGDVNADGIRDFLFASKVADPGGLANAGSVYVHSGADGSLLYQFNGSAAEDRFGMTASGAGDVNADGFDDILVGTVHVDLPGLFDCGAAYLYSGADGSLLFQANGTSDYAAFGSAVVGAGDLNGDGFDDFLIGAVGANSGFGSVSVYSGATLSLLYKIDGNYWMNPIGGAVAATGDVNGDGTDDFILGANRSPSGGITETGSVLVYSGVSGTVIHQVSGQQSFDFMGYSVAGAGDVNGDGYNDFLYATKAAGMDYSRAVKLHSGADGSQMLTLAAEPSLAEFGASLAGGHDVDGDGVPDILVGAPGAVGGGAALLYSGASGMMLSHIQGDFTLDYLGKSVDLLGDLNGDGRAEFIVGATKHDPGGATNAGSVFVFDFNPFLQTDSSSISAATGATITLDLDFPAAAGFYPYQVLMSASGIGPTYDGIKIPLTVDAWTIDAYQGNYPFASFNNLHGVLDASGDSTASFTVTSSQITPAMIGHSFYLAAVTSSTGQRPAEYSSVAAVVTLTP